MVLPAPVGPTIATVWPGVATSERSSISGASTAYENETCSKRTSPCRSPRGAAGPRSSRLCSSASSSSKTRSADATPDWSRLVIEATWVSGWVNWREYWMKAWTSPSDIEPLATRRPPSTAMTT